MTMVTSQRPANVAHFLEAAAIYLPADDVPSVDGGIDRELLSAMEADDLVRDYLKSIGFSLIGGAA